jgi:hypothetical protein
VEIGGRIPAVALGVVWCLPGVVSRREIVSPLIRVYRVGEGEDQEARQPSVAVLRWLVDHGLTLRAEGSTRQLMALGAPASLT